MYFLVDIGGKDADVCDTARSLDRSFQSKPGYVRHRLEKVDHNGKSACVWEFSMLSEEDDFYRNYPIKKLDYFVEGNVYGFAVLFAARPENYDRNIDSFMQVILGSFAPDV